VEAILTVEEYNRIGELGRKDPVCLLDFHPTAIPCNKINFQGQSAKI